MTLADLLAQPTADETKHTPATTFDGHTGTIQTGALTDPPADYAALLREFGYDPDHVEIVGAPRVSRWQQRARNRETNQFETVWLAAYRFTLWLDCVAWKDLAENISAGAVLGI